MNLDREPFDRPEAGPRTPPNPICCYCQFKTRPALEQSLQSAFGLYTSELVAQAEMDPSAE
jgi:hypothetical protein